MKRQRQEKKRGFLSISYLLIVLMIAALTACGGGGGSDGGGGGDDKGGNSAGSAPSAPQNVQSTAADGQVTISWNAVSGATSYNIHWSTTSGVTKSNGTNVAGAPNPYVHSSLTNGTTYYYIVTAANLVGESVPSSEVSATPQAPISAPSAPQNVQAAAGDGQVTISWDSVAGATSYNIYWNTTAGVTTSNNKITGAVSPRNHTGLTNNTTYYYIVTAVNSVGESVPSSEVSAMPLPPISVGLVAYYPFNGNANDESGNGNNGTVIGATLTTDRFGNANSAYSFDGNDYILASATSLPTAERTVALWFYANIVSNKPNLIGYGGSNSTPPGKSWLMGINHWGSPAYSISSHYNTNTLQYFYPQAPINSWIHYAITTNSSGTKIYINGEEKASNSNFINNTVVTGTDLSIGVSVNTRGYAPYTDVNVGYFIGSMDEVRMYNRALTASEIKQLAGK